MALLLPQVEAMLQTYGHKYHSLKSPRTLQWKPTLGTVTLDLRIGDEEIEFTVSPFHASLLMHFTSRSEWAAADLAATMGVTTEVLRKKAIFWMNQGGWHVSG